MESRNNISDAELEVLKELWSAPALTARQLTDRLTERTSWSDPTIKTLLLRLLRKKAVSRSREGEEKVFVYRAVMGKEEFRYQAGRSLLDRLFNGIAGDFLTCLVKNEKMSPEEIESLKRLLDKAAEK